MKYILKGPRPVYTVGAVWGLTRTLNSSQEVNGSKRGYEREEHYGSLEDTRGFFSTCHASGRSHSQGLPRALALMGGEDVG